MVHVTQFSESDPPLRLVRPDDACRSRGCDDRARRLVERLSAHNRRQAAELLDLRRRNGALRRLVVQVTRAKTREAEESGGPGVPGRG